MTLRRFKLPHGTLVVNKGNAPKAFFDKNRNPIILKPGQVHFIGDVQGMSLKTYYLNPEFWDVRLKADEIIKKKGKFEAILLADKADRYGDHILLTLYPEAAAYTYGEKAVVDVFVPKKVAEMWERNPKVGNVYTEKPSLENYDIKLDANNLELKFDVPKGTRCSTDLLERSKLYLANKTPVYLVTKEEKDWAKKYLETVKRPIVGISYFSEALCRRYPHMSTVSELLQEKGYSVIVLDAKDRDGEKYKHSFPEMAALVGECDIIVTHDSAVLHLAGALKKKIVGVFGHTDGRIMAEDYEKATVVQASCTYDKSKNKEICWWEVPCIKGTSYQEKESKTFAPCLQSLNPEEVVLAVDSRLSGKKKVLLCMLTYDLLEMTRRAVDSIRSQYDYDLFVVDNESSDGTPAWLEENGIQFVSKKTSVAAAQNIGIEKFLKEGYDYFILLNNDIVLRYDTIDRLIECADRTGAYGIMSTEVPNTPSWSLDTIVPKNERIEEIENIPAGSYSCTLLSKECLEEVGFFDERYTPRYIEDNDYTLRIRIARGKFIKYNAAIFWHYLGGVVKRLVGEKANFNEDWKRNINIFQETYGFLPHVHQDLDKLGHEWRRDFTVEKIENYIKESDGKVSICIERRMGGYGDILFTTVVARELKEKFGNKIEINYRTLSEFQPLLANNPNIDKVEDFSKKSNADFRLDLTDLEFRVELQEMKEYGEIQSARTEIYLSLVGLDLNLKPDYFVTEKEKEWAGKQWQDSTKLRVAWVMVGSNRLKEWPHMRALIEKCERELGIICCTVCKSNGKSKYTFRESAAIVATADLVVSPDSGISNLAGTLDIPVITLFSNRNKKNFEKMYSSMIGIQGSCPFQEEKDYCDFFCSCFAGDFHRMKEHIAIPKCLKNLKVETVYQEVVEVLKKINKENKEKLLKKGNEEKLLRKLIYEK